MLAGVVSNEMTASDDGGPAAAAAVVVTIVAGGDLGVDASAVVDAVPGFEGIE